MNLFLLKQKKFVACLLLLIHSMLSILPLYAQGKKDSETTFPELPLVKKFAPTLNEKEKEILFRNKLTSVIKHFKREVDAKLERSHRVLSKKEIAQLRNLKLALSVINNNPGRFIAHYYMFLMLTSLFFALNVSEEALVPLYYTRHEQGISQDQHIFNAVAGKTDDQAIAEFIERLQQTCTTFDKTVESFEEQFHAQDKFAQQFTLAELNKLMRILQEDLRNRIGLLNSHDQKEIVKILKNKEALLKEKLALLDPRFSNLVEEDYTTPWWKTALIYGGCLLAASTIAATITFASYDKETGWQTPTLDRLTSNLKTLFVPPLVETHEQLARRRLEYTDHIVRLNTERVALEQVSAERAHSLEALIAQRDHLSATTTALALTQQQIIQQQQQNIALQQQLDYTKKELELAQRAAFVADAQIKLAYQRLGITADQQKKIMKILDRIAATSAAAPPPAPAPPAVPAQPPVVPQQPPVPPATTIAPTQGPQTGPQPPAPQQPQSVESLLDSLLAAAEAQRASAAPTQYSRLDWFKPWKWGKR